MKRCVLLLLASALLLGCLALPVQAADPVRVTNVTVDKTSVNVGDSILVTWEVTGGVPPYESELTWNAIYNIDAGPQHFEGNQGYATMTVRPGMVPVITFFIKCKDEASSWDDYYAGKNGYKSDGIENADGWTAPTDTSIALEQTSVQIGQPIRATVYKAYDVDAGGPMGFYYQWVVTGDDGGEFVTAQQTQWGQYATTLNFTPVHGKSAYLLADAIEYTSADISPTRRHTSDVISITKASGQMEGTATLSRDRAFTGQRISVMLDIRGGTAPYTVTYEWIVYPFDADYDSRPVFHVNETTNELQHSVLLTDAGLGQLDIQVTDSTGQTSSLSGDTTFVVYQPDDFPNEHALTLLTGRWEDSGDNANDRFIMTIGPGGRTQIESSHPAWLWDYDRLTGTASADAGILTLATDLGTRVEYGYEVGINSYNEELLLKLTLPDGLSNYVFYQPDYQYLPFDNMADKATPPPVTEAHKRLLGEWQGRGKYDEYEEYSLELTGDGRIDFAYINAKWPELSTSFQGVVTDVREDTLSYLTDSGYSYYLFFWLTDDGAQMEVVFQDHTGILRRD
ncbi:MAG: hypothetical protein GXZ04_07685 [Clostridiales bacterium]|nr:hypothetical protein [Clostridiales bacterium]